MVSSHLMPTAPLAAELASICRQFPIDALYVFGSRSEQIAGRLRGCDSKTPVSLSSDADIGVQTRVGERLSVAHRVELAIRLEDLFGVARADLVILEEAGAFLALDAIRGELIYCADEYRQAEFELFVLRRAADLAHFERLHRRETLRGVR